MNILHVTSWHSCISLGGTESYIDGLCRGLESVGNIENYSLIFSSLKPVLEQEKICIMWPEASEASFEFSERIAKRIGDLKPDLLFIHTAEEYETSVAAIAVRTGIPYYFFFHARSWLCPRKIMSYMGRFECIKFFNPWRCSVCYSSGNTGSRLLGLTRVIGAELKSFAWRNSQSCWRTFKRELANKLFLVENAQKIIAFNMQDQHLLTKNLPHHRHIEIIPQGLADSCIPTCVSNAHKARLGKLKIGYIGRACEIKGCHLLVEAAASLSDNLDFELHIYGCNPKEKYYDYMLDSSRANPRIFFYELMPLMEIMEKYSELDVLCLPSMVYETGPLTLLEGVYSGCFVGGSANIGQMDFLKNYGKCLQNNTAGSWADFFRECHDSLESIRQNRRSKFEQYRTMETIAREILDFTEGKTNE